MISRSASVHFGSSGSGSGVAAVKASGRNKRERKSLMSREGYKELNNSSPAPQSSYNLRKRALIDTPMSRIVIRRNAT
jgi:hypothetical protein